MTKVSRDTLLERTTDAEVFQDMDNFELLNDSGQFALSIRLQFPKFSKGFNVSDFQPFIEEYVGEDNVATLGRLSFPNEWQMELKNSNIRESLIRMGRTKINTRTCWISPLSQSEVRGFIHWIPSAIPNIKLKEKLRAFGEILFMENQRQTKWKTKINCESRYFGLYLKSGKTMDDLPHFIKLEEYYGLITIRGRSPSCFHCKQVGHKKTECKAYREKLSDYCLRPPGQGVPRFKPRGKRFKKRAAQVQPVTKVDQACQTDTSCGECIKERLASDAERAEENAALVSDDTEEESVAGTEASVARVVFEIGEWQTLTPEDVVKVGFWRAVRAEKKRLKTAGMIEELAEFREKVKSINEAAAKESSNLSVSSSATGDYQSKMDDSQMKVEDSQKKVDSQRKVDASPTKVDASPTKVDASPTKVDASPTKVDASPTKVDASQTKVDASQTKVDDSQTKVDDSQTKVENPQRKVKTVSGKSDNAVQVNVQSTEAQETVVAGACTEEIDIAARLQLIQKNMEEVLKSTKEQFELELAAARDMFQVQKTKKSAGKKKRNKKKNKKAAENPPDEGPKDA